MCKFLRKNSALVRQTDFAVFSPGLYAEAGPIRARPFTPRFQASTWNGQIAPAATPKDIVAKLNADIVRAARA